MCALLKMHTIAGKQIQNDAQEVSQKTGKGHKQDQKQNVLYGKQKAWYVSNKPQSGQLVTGNYIVCDWLQVQSVNNQVKM